MRFIERKISFGILELPSLMMLLLSMVVPSSYLPIIIAISLLIILINSVSYIELTILSCGLFFYLIHFFNGYNDIRFLLPFILLTYSKHFEIPKHVELEKKINIIYLLWLVYVISFITATATSSDFAESSLYNSYYSELANNFIYDINDLTSYRVGSFYFNPNQLAYVYMVLSIVAFNLKGIKPYVIIAGFVIFMLTQSRTLAIFILYYFMIYLILNRSTKLIIITIVVLISFFITANYYNFGGIRVLAHANSTIEHALFKIYLMDNFIKLDSLYIIFGSGYNKDLSFDADLGSFLYYYGIIAGPILYFFCLYSLRRYIPYSMLPMIVLITYYGTIFSNTRMVTILGAFSVINIVWRIKIQSATRLRD